MRYVLLTAAVLLAMFSWLDGPGGRKFRHNWNAESERHAQQYMHYE